MARVVTPSCCWTFSSFIRRLFCCWACSSTPNRLNDQQNITNKSKITIMTYNVQLLIGFISQAKIDLLINRVTARTDLDVICFQEVFSERAREQLLDELKTIWPYYIAKAGNDTIKSEDSGLMVFSRFPVLKHHFLPFKSAYSVDALSQRGGLSFTIDTGCYQPTIVNLHLQSDYSQKDDNTKRIQVRKKQLKQIASLKSDIVVGDFNMIYAKTEYKSISSILKKKDVIIGPRSQTHTSGQTLDYIFSRNDYKVTKARITSFETQWQLPSDHYAVEATIKLS